MRSLYTFFAAALLLGITFFISWRLGWTAHADHINVMAAQKRDKAEKVIQPIEQKAAQAKEDGIVIYRTITRDVVKYVQSPDRTVCKFDDDAIKLRQRAIDVTNSISGFDATPVQSK
ncbi:hypothetical protein [Serratia fonticola]